MFVKRDLRKVLDVLSDPSDARTELKLARRAPEFEGGSTAPLLFSRESAPALTRVRYVSLYDDGLTRLAGVSHLAAAAAGVVEDLNVGRNRLAELPASLAGLAPGLKRVWADDNELGPDFPAVLLALTRLTHLRLSGNRIAAVPPGVAALGALEELALDANALAALPDELGSLRRLRTLVLRGNALAALPETVGGLGALVSLSVSSNALRRLPRALGECAALESLTANSNALLFLPATLARCRRLAAVNASHTALQCLPHALVRAWAGALPEGVAARAAGARAAFVAALEAGGRAGARFAYRGRAGALAAVVARLPLGATGAGAGAGGQGGAVDAAGGGGGGGGGGGRGGGRDEMDVDDAAGDADGYIFAEDVGDFAEPPPDGGDADDAGGGGGGGGARAALALNVTYTPLNGDLEEPVYKPSLVAVMRARREEAAARKG